MPSPIAVALLGADTLLGEAMLEALEDRPFPIRRITLIAADDEASQETLAGAERVFVAADEVDLAALDLVLVADAQANLTALFQRGDGHALRWLDVTGRHPAFDQAPVVVEQVAPRFVDTPRLRCARPAVVALLPVLRALRHQAGLDRVILTLMQPMSDAGRTAVETLGQETAALLNFRAPPNSPFPAQIAFNLMPMSAGMEGMVGGDEAVRVSLQLAQQLETASEAVDVSALWAPLFYGIGLSVVVDLGASLEIAACEQLLRAIPGLRWIDAPTPVGDASGQVGLAIGQLRGLGGQGTRLGFWAVADNIRYAGVDHALRLAASWFGNSYQV